MQVKYTSGQKGAIVTSLNSIFVGSMGKDSVDLGAATCEEAAHHNHCSEHTPPGFAQLCRLDEMDGNHFLLPGVFLKVEDPANAYAVRLKFICRRNGVSGCQQFWLY